MSVRVRFAPSPTGHLHVGGARSALYNWLFARSSGGVLVLRSDDTDAERSTDEYRADITASLEWLGIDWDEGIDVGGPHGSYRQSDRFDRYREVATDLVGRGLAYYSFETREQLDGFRREAQAAGAPPSYDGRFRVSDDEARERIEAGERAPVRFAVPRPGATGFNDVIRGQVEFDHSQVDDFVILRSDGSPTYHLASTVDDVDYGITHVVRGEDILPSTPKHILLTQAMGIDPPVYAHLSLLLGPDGAKLSKRHGHTAVRAYREAGYLPEAVRNYLAILGWSPGEDEEIVSIDDMVDRFDLSAVSRNPAVFDVTKLEWMSGVYVRALDPEDFVIRTVPLVAAELGRELTDPEIDTYRTIAPLAQERAKRLAEVAEQVLFLFGDIEYDERSWQKVMTKEGAREAIAAASAALGGLATWSTDSIEEACRGVAAALEMGAGKVFQPIRVAITGSSVSPPLFESIEALGRERTLSRLTESLAHLDSRQPTADS